MFTALTIIFRKHEEPYKLKRKGTAGQQGEQLISRVNAQLHESKTTSVFRATSPAFAKNEQLVLKVMYGSPDSPAIKAIRHEFNMYDTKLKALQGRVVPRCHGLFEGRISSGFVSCLVLDYVGETQFLLIEELSMDYR